MHEVAGEMYWEIRFSPVHNENGFVTGVSIDSLNITEIKLQQRQIVSQNEMLRKIAHIQSHEVRRPLANIISFTELLHDKNQEDFDELISYLRSEAFSLDDKIRNIVELSNNLKSSFL